MIERRKFSRVVYQTDVILLHNGTSLHGSLIDLSLHGLLVVLDDDYELKPNTKMNVSQIKFVFPFLIIRELVSSLFLLNGKTLSFYLFYLGLVHSH
jgi:c-di-GMP-binding flagellar brake protein YcgR